MDAWITAPAGAIRRYGTRPLSKSPDRHQRPAGSRRGGTADRPHPVDAGSPDPGLRDRLNPLPSEIDHRNVRHHGHRCRRLGIGKFLQFDAARRMLVTRTSTVIAAIGVLDLSRHQGRDADPHRSSRRRGGKPETEEQQHRDDLTRHASTHGSRGIWSSNYSGVNSGETKPPEPMRRDLVGVAGFEPTASSTRTKRATRLRHTPIIPAGTVPRLEKSAGFFSDSASPASEFSGGSPGTRRGPADHKRESAGILLPQGTS